jgi:hypothetical protein
MIAVTYWWMSFSARVIRLPNRSSSRLVIGTRFLGHLITRETV